MQIPFEEGRNPLSEARGKNQSSEFTKCIISQVPIGHTWHAWLGIIHGGLNDGTVDEGYEHGIGKPQETEQDPRLYMGLKDVDEEADPGTQN